MKKDMTTVEEYIAAFPTTVAERLTQLRNMVLQEAPDAQEGISYGMPAYKLNGKPLVYFAAFANHIGVYATPSGHAHFAQELSGYKQGKGSVQFPLSQPLPMPLITDMVRFKVTENLTKVN